MSPRIKFTLLGVGIVLTMAFLLTAAIRSSEGMHFYMTVSEYMAKGEPRETGLRVNGKVVPGTIERLPRGTGARFVMEEGGARLTVHYEGELPDTFVDGADVVVEGRPHTDGTFRATLLLAKCPSKYEAAEDAYP